MASLFRAYKCVDLFPTSSFVDCLLTSGSLLYPFIIVRPLTYASFTERTNERNNTDSRALIQRPFLTQCLSSAVLFGAGDVLAQEAVEKRGWERYDVRFAPFILSLSTIATSHILSSSKKNWWNNILITLQCFRPQPIRTLRLSLYGGAFFGPPVTKWFQFLGRLQFASPTKAVVYRVCFFLFCGPSSITSFLVSPSSSIRNLSIPCSDVRSLSLTHTFGCI